MHEDVDMNTPILKRILLHLNESPVQIPRQLNHPSPKKLRSGKNNFNWKRDFSFAVNQLSAILCILVDVNIRER